MSVLWSCYELKDSLDNNSRKHKPCHDERERIWIYKVQLKTLLGKAEATEEAFRPLSIQNPPFLGLQSSVLRGTSGVLGLVNPDKN